VQGNLGESVILDKEFVPEDWKSSELQNAHIFMHQSKNSSIYHANSESTVQEIGYGQFLAEGVMKDVGCSEDFLAGAGATS